MAGYGYSDLRSILLGSRRARYRQPLLSAELDSLYAQQVGLVGLIAAPVFDHLLRVFATDEELDRLLRLHTHDAADDHSSLEK
jgi:hypothetical protein